MTSNWNICKNVKNKTTMERPPKAGGGGQSKVECQVGKYLLTDIYRISCKGI